ncbi:MAG: hypothetical protein IPJ88_08430 [Myxococcales bacterium]|nr:MAG: hypothetical protein IPJ88_08430 [Myxococcales bacterium]
MCSVLPCLVSPSDDLGTDGSNQTYSGCDIPADCDGISAADQGPVSICDQLTHQCISDEDSTLLYQRNQVSKEQNLSPETMHPVTEAATPQGWPFAATKNTENYKRLVAEFFALPLLEQEQKAIAKLESDIAYANFKGITSYFQSVAGQMSKQYTNLQAQDEFIGSIAKSVEKEKRTAAKLEECVAAFQNDSSTVDLSSALLQRCTELYTSLLPKLQDINAKRGKIALSTLDHLQETSWWLRELASGMADDIKLTKDLGGKYVHASQLAATMLAVYHTLLDDEIEAQGMYSHLRIHITQEVPVQSFGNTVLQEVALPLGRWAEIATEQDNYLEQPQQVRIQWFMHALDKVIPILKANNAQAAAIMSGQNEETEDWEYALVMEQSGLMAMYGGYDESGQPIGFQGIHDTLLAQAKAQEFAVPGVAIATTLACLGVSLALGPTSFVAVGTCLVATGVGVYQYFKLAHLANLAQTLAYVGLEHSLVPPTEASRLRLNRDLTAVLTIVDVLFAAYDVAQSSAEVLHYAKNMGWIDESITFDEIQNAARTKLGDILFGKIEVAHAMGRGRPLKNVDEVIFSPVPGFSDRYLSSAIGRINGVVEKQANNLSRYTQAQDKVDNFILRLSRGEIEGQFFRSPQGLGWYQLKINSRDGAVRIYYRYWVTDQGTFIEILAKFVKQGTRSSDQTSIIQAIELYLDKVGG